MSDQTQLQSTIEERIAQFDPQVELIALEKPSAETLRLYIDPPSGVDHGVCERVSTQLRDLRESYGLEVSSPGVDRPLTKPEHYRRFLGRRVKVRTAEPIGGRRNFTGTLTEADESTVSIAADGAEVEIPLADVRRSNLVPEFGN